jgi:hypothetical protein
MKGQGFPSNSELLSLTSRSVSLATIIDFFDFEIGLECSDLITIYSAIVNTKILLQQFKLLFADIIPVKNLVA